MRSLVFLIALAFLIPPSLAMPHIAALVWAWLSFMNPHRETWGAVFGMPWVMPFAVLTMLAWLLSREPKRIPMSPAILLIVAFAVWMTINTFFALSPELAWPIWDRTIKTLILAVALAGLITTRVRIHALVWIICVSLGYYAVKGGGFAILTGGNYRVWGPQGSMIYDNNHIALALVMTMPLLNYLRLYSERKLVRNALILVMILTLVAVVGTYSRGGAVALAAMLGFLWWKSKRKLITGMIGAALLAPVLLFMPHSWYERVESTADYQEDDSFRGRIEAWENAVVIAAERPIWSAGFRGTYDPLVVERYNPGNAARAAHSIYFEVLGDLGYLGLAIWLAIAGFTWLNCRYIIARTRDRPDLNWASDLARMTQVSLAGYFVAGAALSMAYYDVFYALVVAMVAVRRIVAAAVQSAVASPFARPADSSRGYGRPAPAE